jgi:hypothetical protein
VTTPQTDEYGASLAQGMESFNQGKFWEAHHDWEKGWNRLPSPYKEYQRALIQACGVFYHLERRNWDPARRLAIRVDEEISIIEKSGGIGVVLPRVDIPGLFPLMREIALAPRTVFDPQISTWLATAKRLKASLCLT